MSSERDGNWVDKFGACKVCDGEIPHGHTKNCDIYKLEQERDSIVRLHNKAEQAIQTILADTEQQLKECREENEQLKQVLNKVLLECKEPSCQDIHAEPWIPDELGDLIRQKLRPSKT